MWKSLQFVPAVAKPKGSRKLAAVVPIFFTVTICVLLAVPTATLPKLSPVGGDNVKMMLPVPVPVPLRDNLCGLPGALSAMVTPPDLAPVKVGVNLTVSLQEAPPAAKVVGQLLPS